MQACLARPEAHTDLCEDISTQSGVFRIDGSEQMTTEPKNKPQECARGCGKKTRRMSQFLHEDKPHPTCKECDEIEEQQNVEEEAEEAEEMSE